MSTQSLISVPPELELKSRSISFLEKNRTDRESVTNEQYSKSGIIQTDKFPSGQQLSTGVLSTKSSVENEVRTFYKLSETTFPMKQNEPLNVRISLQPLDLLKLTKPKMVNNKKNFYYFL